VFAGLWLVIRVVGGNRSIDCERFQPPNAKRSKNVVGDTEGDHFCCGAFGLGCSASNHRSGTFFLVPFFWLQKKGTKSFVSIQKKGER